MIKSKWQSKRLLGFGMSVILIIAAIPSTLQVLAKSSTQYESLGNFDLMNAKISATNPELATVGVVDGKLKVTPVSSTTTTLQTSTSTTQALTTTSTTTTSTSTQTSITSPSGLADPDASKLTLTTNIQNFEAIATPLTGSGSDTYTWQFNTDANHVNPETGSTRSEIIQGLANGAINSSVIRYWMRESFSTKNYNGMRMWLQSGCGKDIEIGIGFNFDTYGSNADDASFNKKTLTAKVTATQQGGWVYFDTAKMGIPKRSLKYIQNIVVNFSDMLNYNPRTDFVLYMDDIQGYEGSPYGLPEVTGTAATTTTTTLATTSSTSGDVSSPSAPITIEAENCSYTGTPTPGVLNDALGNTVSIAASALGNYLTLTSNTDLPAGTYDVEVRSRDFNSRGIYQMSIDGVNVGDPINFYDPASSAAVYKIHAVGAFTVTGGKPVIKFTLTSFNPVTSGKSLYVDYIRFTPYDPTLNNPPDETSGNLPGAKIQLNDNALAGKAGLRYYAEAQSYSRNIFMILSSADKKYAAKISAAVPGELIEKPFAGFKEYSGDVWGADMTESAAASITSISFVYTNKQPDFSFQLDTLETFATVEVVPGVPVDGILADFEATALPLNLCIPGGVTGELTYQLNTNPANAGSGNSLKIVNTAGSNKYPAFQLDYVAGSLVADGIQFWVKPGASGLGLTVVAVTSDGAEYKVYKWIQNTGLVTVNYTELKLNGSSTGADATTVASSLCSLRFAHNSNGSIGNPTYYFDDLSLVRTSSVTVASGITGGIVQTSVVTAKERDSVLVTVTPDAGYRLAAGGLTYTVGDKELPLYKRQGSKVFAGAQTNDEINSNIFFFTMPATSVTVNAVFVPVGQPNLAVYGASYRSAAHADGSGLQFGSRVYRSFTDGAGTWNLSEYGTLLLRKDAVGSLDLNDAAAVESWMTANPSKCKTVKSTQLMDRCADYVDYAVRLTGVTEKGLENTEYIAMAYATYTQETQMVRVISSPIVRSYNQVMNVV